MVLAEMIASGELSSLARPGAEPAARHPMQLEGTALVDGIALGHVVLHEPRVVITNVIADDVPSELKRLDAAIATLRADLDRLVDHGDVADAGEHRDVLEAYRMFAYDQGWLHKMRRRSAPASPPRPASSACSPTPARACCAPPTPICASGCTISTISPTG